MFTYVVARKEVGATECTADNFKDVRRAFLKGYWGDFCVLSILTHKTGRVASISLYGLAEFLDALERGDVTAIIHSVSVDPRAAYRQVRGTQTMMEWARERRERDSYE
jgi:hypothetical protein